VFGEHLEVYLNLFFLPFWARPVGLWCSVHLPLPFDFHNAYTKKDIEKMSMLVKALVICRVKAPIYFS